MTVTEQPRRPSPRPRTETTTNQPPVSTESNGPLSAGQSPAPAVERETAPDSPETLHSPITLRDAGVERWNRFKTHFVMPSPLAEKAPAVQQLKAYAEQAPWTAKHDGPVRFAGILYCRCVAIPYTVWSRIREHIWQRPSRLIVTAVTVKLLTFLPPVAWTVDHLITPGVNAALWLFL